jgi:hypothetical protein
MSINVRTETSERDLTDAELDLVNGGSIILTAVVATALMWPVLTAEMAAAAYLALK